MSLRNAKLKKNLHSAAVAWGQVKASMTVLFALNVMVAELNERRMTMKVKLYYHWEQYDWQDEGCVTVSTYDMSEHSQPHTLLHVADVEIPDIDAPTLENVVKSKTAKLEDEKSKLMADTHIKLAAIDDKIRQLQSLEYME